MDELEYVGGRERRGGGRGGGGCGDQETIADTD